MQKGPGAQGMVSIISHYLGYWTERTDIAVQGMFCNKIQILPHDFPLAKPRPCHGLSHFWDGHKPCKRCPGLLTEQAGSQHLLLWWKCEIRENLPWYKGEMC